MLMLMLLLMLASLVRTGLKPLFCGVLVAVAVVVCLRSLFPTDHRARRIDWNLTILKKTKQII